MDKRTLDKRNVVNENSSLPPLPFRTVHGSVLHRTALIDENRISKEDRKKKKKEKEKFYFAFNR